MTNFLLWSLALVSGLLLLVSCNRCIDTIFEEYTDTEERRYRCSRAMFPHLMKRFVLVFLFPGSLVLGMDPIHSLGFRESSHLLLVSMFFGSLIGIPAVGSCALAGGYGAKFSKSRCKLFSFFFLCLGVGLTTSYYFEKQQYFRAFP